jgi:hypothetical protein
MQGYVVDLYREDGLGGGKGRYLRLPLQEAYSPDRMAAGWGPVATPKLLSGFAMEIVPLKSTDCI